MRLPHYLVGASAVAVFACGRGAAEPPAISLIIEPATVRATGTRSLVTVGNFTMTRISCDYQVVARADGGRGVDFVQWSSASGTWFAVGGGQIDAFTLAYRDLIDWFGSDRVSQGKTVTAHRIATAAQPFVLVTAFHYQLPSGEIRTATHTLFCD